MVLKGFLIKYNIGAINKSYHVSFEQPLFYDEI